MLKEVNATQQAEVHSHATSAHTDIYFDNVRLRVSVHADTPV